MVTLQKCSEELQEIIGSRGADTPHDWTSDEVVAWMPLPEPYEAESEVKE